MTVGCNAAKFANLKNPYTGEKMNVKMLVRSDGSPLFFCPDTYSTATYFPTALEAIEAWDRRDGVGGLKKRDSMKCAYTGEDLNVVEDCAGFYLEGGFDPHRLMTDDEFVYYASMRDGKCDLPVPSQTPRVESVDRASAAVETSDDSGPTDEMLKAAEKTVNQFKDSVGMKTETVVSMSRKGKRK